jgi:Core-2/I-Branching enzyme
MKVCYLIQTYKNSDQIIRLVRTLKESSPNCLIIISHNVAGDTLEIEPIQHFSDIYIFYVQGKRGNFITVQNYLDAIAWLLNNTIEFDWLINLSGQDYPIRPIFQFEESLKNTNFDGFIEHFKVFSTESPWGIKEGYTRYYYRYYVLTQQLSESLKERLKPLKSINYIQPFFRINFAYNVVFGTRIVPPFNDSLICYGGSYFNTLSRKCLEYLHQFSQANPNIIKYYERVSVPEESFVQTVLLNSNQFNLSNEPKHYIDFSGTKQGRPRIFTASDYASLIDSQRFFARKFDLNCDRTILDLLDQQLAPAASTPLDNSTTPYPSQSALHQSPYSK